MKKHILFLSLILSISSFSSANGADKNENSNEKMNITATVIEPLTVVSKGDINFGNILPGSVTSASSGYTITGEKDAKIEITFPGAHKYLETETENAFSMPLTSTTTTDKLPFAFNTGTVGKNVTLDSNGKTEIYIPTTVSPRDNQTRGIYSGTITLRAVYQ